MTIARIVGVATGFTDFTECVMEGSASSCGWAAASATPLKAGKLGKLAKGSDDAVEASARALPDDVIALSERNITSSGDTVLGSYPGYIQKANDRRASYFDIGDRWKTLTPAQRTAANNHFLDIIAARGDRVLLSTEKKNIRKDSALADEVTYLTQQKDYVWVNQWALMPSAGR